MTYNQKVVKTELQRIEICDLLIACTMIANASGAEKWHNLHDKLSNILAKFDNEHIEEWA